MLTVGSDCAIGKMTVAVELDLEARRRGLKSVFVPTGQTGIAIAGWGIAVDAVISDFLAGAAEWLVVEGARRGGELPVRRGPGLADHIPRTRASPSGSSTARRRTTSSSATRPARPRSRAFPGTRCRACRARGAARADLATGEAGTSGRDRRQHGRPRRGRCTRGGAEAAEETGLPADDPVRFGAERLVDAVATLAKLKEFHGRTAGGSRR